MSAEENILIPKARYEKLLARMTEENQKSDKAIQKGASAQPVPAVEVPGELPPSETPPKNHEAEPGRNWDEILSNHRDFLPPGSDSAEGFEPTPPRPRKASRVSKGKGPKIKKATTVNPRGKALKTTKTTGPYSQLARKWLTVSRK